MHSHVGKTNFRVASVKLFLLAAEWSFSFSYLDLGGLKKSVNRITNIFFKTSVKFWQTVIAFL